MTPKLSVNIGKLKLKNPVLVSSGTFGYAQEFKAFLNLSALGAIVTKTITLKPRQGNPPPRTCETPAGMLNSIGLQNPGIERFIDDKLPSLGDIGVPLIASISSEEDIGEFVILAKRLDKIKQISAIELNISCPNIRAQGSGLKAQGKAIQTKLISQDPVSTYAVVRSVRMITNKTIITKLSPNVDDIAEIASAAERAGSDAVSLINTLTGMSIDTITRTSKIACVTGGLSGPAIRPVAVRMVREVFEKIKIPIIGMGGIIDTPSALEFFIAGSTAISVGTANFINPKAATEIISGIKQYLTDNKINDIKQLIGSLRL